MNLIPYLADQIHNLPWYRKNKKQEVDTRKTVSCIFVVDTSESMNYPVDDPAIEYLNQALKTFPVYVKRQNINNINIDVSLIEPHNNGARIVSQFVPISRWEPEHLTAEGLSPIGRCLETAIQLAMKRMDGVEPLDKPSYPVWILLFTDGRSTDGLNQAREWLKEQNLKGKNDFLLWIIATENADMRICRSLSEHIILMKHRDYDSVFRWTSNCIRMLSSHKEITFIPPHSAKLFPDKSF